MIVLDTNVVSETLKPAPQPEVLAWLDAQEPRTLFLTTINVAELLAGVAVLPMAHRRRELQRALDEQVLPLFLDRVLAFDERAARAYARVHAGAQVAGRPVSFADAAIAAIALAHGYSIATRNLADFEGSGVPLIDPWQARV